MSSAIHSSPSVETIGMKRLKTRPASLDRPLPVKAACQACRTRKQRCDGNSPSCGRCIKEQRSCHYVQSRRGQTYAHLHRPGRQTAPAAAAAAAAVKPPTAPEIFKEDRGSSASKAVALNDTRTNNSDVVVTSAPKLLKASDSINSADSDSCSIFDVTRNVQEFCHQLFTEKSRYLLLLVKHIGHLYSDNIQQDPMPLPLPTLPEELPKTIESVQALILLSVVTHMHYQPHRAQDSFGRAIAIALDLGLHKREFAPGDDQSAVFVEESWRRTWWEIFILDATFAALHNTKRPRIPHLWRGVLLPAEEGVFRGQMPPSSPSSMEDFDDRIFAEQSAYFSSFTYRIAAARALGHVLQAAEDQALGNISTTREAELALDNLFLHLPTEKKDYAQLDGVMDEVLFGAHMIMHMASIYLHRPQSDLSTVEERGPLLCVNSTQLKNTGSLRHHTKKCLDSANKICLMVSGSENIASHTPFFTCALAIQSVVQLGAYWRPDLSHQQSIMHQQVQLAVGALKELEMIWPMASIVLKQIKEVARAVLAKQRLSDQVPENEMVRAMLEEDISAATSATNFENFLKDNDAWLDQFLG